VFVSFADALRAPDNDACTLVMPERGVFAVVEAPPDAQALVTSALDAGLRTSTATDDIAEVLDGIHEELRGRDTLYSLALAVVEADALAFFGVGTCMASLSGAFSRREVVTPRDRPGGGVGGPGGPGGDVRFFRAYVRAGTRAELLTEGAWRAREIEGVHAAMSASLPKHADFYANGRGSHAPAAAVILRVDEEPRIR
jgi:hypothetical protein